MIGGTSVNPVIENLRARKSVRAFEERPIPEDVKREILLAAMEAPTAGNQQLYTILDITDQALKEKLAVSCDNQPFIAQAPLVLVFCADAKKWHDVYLDCGCAPRRPGKGDIILATQDAVIAAQNAVTAAWSLGVGSCYIGDILDRREEHREMLNLPRYAFPATMVVFGYPSKQQIEREKPARCALTHIVHENAYREMDGAELRDMLGWKAKQQTYEAWCRAFCARKYNSDFAREMNRSVTAYFDEFPIAAESEGFQ